MVKALFAVAYKIFYQLGIGYAIL